MPGDALLRLVFCHTSFLGFRAHCARQCKARSAGNIKHIGKDRNTAVTRMKAPEGRVA